MKGFIQHQFQVKNKLSIVFSFKKNKSKNGAGFTLIETLIAIAILTIIMIAVFSSIVILYKTQSFSWDQAVAVEEARAGIRKMTREIREARLGDDGSYPIEKAEDKEFVFYSDIDKDNQTEKVRYFLGSVSSGSQMKECVTFDDGGSCDISFFDFFNGDLKSAEIKISVEGDFGWNNVEYASVYIDGAYNNNICKTGCTDCPGSWQGTSSYDVTTEATDNLLNIMVDSNFRVDNICDWINLNHAMKIRVELTWEEENSELAHQLRKGVTNPTSNPISYPMENEEVSIISSYIRNAPPIFEYYDADGDLIIEYPARLSDTKLMKLHLVVNVNPDRAPDDIEIESYIQLRNLQNE